MGEWHSQPVRRSQQSSLSCWLLEPRGGNAHFKRLATYLLRPERNEWQTILDDLTRCAPAEIVNSRNSKVIPRGYGAFRGIITATFSAATRSGRFVRKRQFSPVSPYSTFSPNCSAVDAKEPIREADTKQRLQVSQEVRESGDNSWLACNSRKHICIKCTRAMRMRLIWCAYRTLT
jgi:hypothetical protein